MPKGQATGQDRDYENLCQGIIQQLHSEQSLVPNESRQFLLCGAKVTFDAVLRDQQKSRFVVIESKRYGNKSAVKLRDVFALWAEITWLSEYLQKTVNSGVVVKGIIITKSTHQDGAIKVASALGIQLYICGQDQSPQAFALTGVRLGPSNLVARDVTIKVPSASYTLTGGSAKLTVNRGGE